MAHTLTSIIMQPLSFLITVFLFVASLSSATPLQTYPRRTVSQVAIGSVIDHCAVPGTIALTFDDGPWMYTSQILDTLAEHDALATFFLNGINKGSIDSYPDVIQRAVAEGHQIGSHTYVCFFLPSPVLPELFRSDHMQLESPVPLHPRL